MDQESKEYTTALLSKYRSIKGISETKILTPYQILEFLEGVLIIVLQYETLDLGDWKLSIETEDDND